MMISEKNKINYLTKGFFGIKYFREMRKSDFSKDGNSRCIQLNVEKNGKEKDYLISGRFDQSELLKISLHRRGISYRTMNSFGKEVPDIKGQEYQVLGLGGICTFKYKDEDFLLFFKSSSAFTNLSINKQSLENSFGEQEIIDLNNNILNSFLVNYCFS